MKLYHYTSIEALALILKNKNIKFNRLDQVDDIEECESGSGPINLKLGKYTFVSCWTKDNIENIALWKMYTNFRGVRIAFDSDMFTTYKIGNETYSFYKNIFHLEKDYFIFPFINDTSPIDIIYDNEAHARIKNAAFQLKQGVLYNPKEIGIYKNKQWEFQKETRFIVHSTPVDLKVSNSKSLLKIISDGICYGVNNNIDISDINIFIPLKNDIFHSMEILMGPKTNDAELAIVEALLYKYCKGIKVEVLKSRLKIR